MTCADNALEGEQLPQGVVFCFKVLFVMHNTKEHAHMVIFTR